MRVDADAGLQNLDAIRGRRGAGEQAQHKAATERKPGRDRRSHRLVSVRLAQRGDEEAIAASLAWQSLPARATRSSETGIQQNALGVRVVG
ncbi:MAG: hypothetical protein BWZ07_00602 [Alphaproteobacteria bacterium ADurb.BinA280]|nr:MAG: hypothetical protein BWZ07_00602 [Alphaproteobacteria bacterium ADurb.BinA280]